MRAENRGIARTNHVAADYTFLDFGASSGGSIRWAAKNFGGRGLGVDIDERKIAALRSKGFDGICADIRDTTFEDDVVKYVVMMDFLEHLPNIETASEIVNRAVQIAKDFVYIVGPDFDHAPYLHDLGLKKYFHDWTGHTFQHTTAQLRKLIDPHKDCELSLLQFERVYDSYDHSILPIDAQKNSSTFDPGEGTVKQYMKFDRKMFRRVMVVINKSRAYPTPEIIVRGLNCRFPYEIGEPKPFYDE